MPDCEDLTVTAVADIYARYANQAVHRDFISSPRLVEGLRTRIHIFEAALYIPF